MPDQVEATPAFVIDAPKVEQNIARLAAYAREHGLGVRPHTKTHKSLQMARLQLEHGAIGLTVAKVGEAEVMAEASRDLLVGYPAIDAHRTARLAKLAHAATVCVAVDSIDGIDALARAAGSAGSTIGVLVDLDVGFHRTGVQSPADSLALAQHISKLQSLRLDGLFFYPGHIGLPANEQGPELHRIDAMLNKAIELWRKAGLAAPIVSGGSTPTAYQSHLLPSLTEIRPGTYPYNDMNTARGGFCKLDECAAVFVCTVVSNAVPGKVVIDAGTKTLTSDRNARFPDSGHGHLIEYPDAKIVRLSEEHGEVDVTACDRKPKIGERVRVIPNHICPCVNLQDAVWIQDSGGKLTSMRVDARGRLS